MEGADAQSDINDGTLLRSLVLNLNASKLGIFVSGHEQDSTLGELLEQIARGKAVFVGEVGERFLLAVDKFELQGRNLEYQLETLSLQVKQSNIICNASELPALIRIVCAPRLKHGHRCKLQRSELNLPFCEVEGCNFACVLVAPLLLLVIPDGDLHLGRVVAHVDCGRQLELDLDADVGCDVGRRIGVGNVSHALLDGQNGPHGPLGSLLALLGELVHLEVDDSAHDEIILNLLWRQVVIAGPKGSNDNLTTGLLLWQLGDVIVEFDVMAILILACNVRPQSKQNVTLASKFVQNISSGQVTL